MKTIEVLVHAYAEKLDVYAKSLTAQLSSLVLWPPKRCHVRVLVCCCQEDLLVANVVASFSTLFYQRGLHQIVVARAIYPKEQLFRRSIARNLLAKTTKADVVHFADADYLYGPGFLDALCETEWPADLVYPRRMVIHKSHAVGDWEYDRITPGELFTPELSLFEPWKTRFASGGIQFVKGDAARAKGYLDGHKRFQKPVDPAQGFCDTLEDTRYRATMKGWCAIKLPGPDAMLYRMRHSQSAFEQEDLRGARMGVKRKVRRERKR